MSLGRASVVLLFAGVLAIEACAEIAGIDAWAPSGEGSDNATSSAGGSATTSTSAPSSTAAAGGGGAGMGGAGAGASTSATTGKGGGGGQTDHCMNGVPDQGETGADCGGGVCPKCEASVTCNDGSDCLSNCCSTNDWKCCYGTTMVCIVSCANGCQDGDETDRDCGGSCLKKCVQMQKCLMSSDCDAGLGLTCQGFMCLP